MEDCFKGQTFVKKHWIMWGFAKQNAASGHVWVYVCHSCAPSLAGVPWHRLAHAGGLPSCGHYRAAWSLATPGSAELHSIYAPRPTVHSCSRLVPARFCCCIPL